MAYLVDIKTSFPKNYYNQEELTAALLKVWGDKITNHSRIETLQKNVLVESRHLSMPLESYFNDMTFGERNRQFIEVATEISKNAIKELLEANNLNAEEISSLWSNTVTGFSIPSLEARIMNLLPFKTDTKRVPLMGLGCMAGVAGINRVSDYLKGHPKEAVVFFSVECCSLTFQMGDLRVANLLSTALFGDGAAAVLMVGDEHPLALKAPLKLKDNLSVFFPESEDVMGWDVSEKGLSIILNKNVPDVTEKELQGPLDDFLSSRKISLGDIKSFFAHPGGPKVMMALEKVLDLPQGGLTHSWESLKQNGNMSSVSVLDIFHRHLELYRKDPDRFRGKWGLSVAMGPAFSAELGLFKWN
jgi:alkylresorcinol/alkylpyrone synthase